MMCVCGEAAELVVELNHHPEVFQGYSCYGVPGFKNALQCGRRRFYVVYTMFL